METEHTTVVLEKGQMKWARENGYNLSGLMRMTLKKLQGEENEKGNPSEISE